MSRRKREPLAEGMCYLNQRGELVGPLAKVGEREGGEWASLSQNGTAPEGVIYDDEGKAWLPDSDDEAGWLPEVGACYLRADCKFDLLEGSFEGVTVTDMDGKPIRRKKKPVKPKRRVAGKYRNLSLRLREGGYYMSRDGAVCGPVELLEEPIAMTGSPALGRASLEEKTNTTTNTYTMAHIMLTEPVADILRRATITADLLTLPPGQLDRKLYEGVAKAINLLGGQWKTNRKGFVLAATFAEAFAGALGTGKVIDIKKERQAFYTPQVIAEKIVAYAKVRGCVVLEPSAGGGALADACRLAGAKEVVCIEKDKATADELAKRYPTLCADFLSVPPTRLRRQFTRVIMNPPFTRDQWRAHIEKAMSWLSPGGELYSLLPASTAVGTWIRFNGGVIPYEFLSGEFKESGTAIDTLLVKIVK
jgi:predicted RNA methylase